MSATLKVGGWARVTLVAVLLTGCGETPEATPGEDAWDTPELEGDGLPPSSDTQHGTPPPTGATPMPGEGDTPAPEQPALVVVDGLFAWSSKNGLNLTGTLVLFSASVSCHDLFGVTDTVSPDGLYFTIFPMPFVEPTEAWVQSYPVCGSPPCFRGYSKVAGESVTLEADASLTVSSYDDHYLTVSWVTPVSEGEGLTLYNCGDRLNWSY